MGKIKEKTIKIGLGLNIFIMILIIVFGVFGIILILSGPDEPVKPDVYDRNCYNLLKWGCDEMSQEECEKLMERKCRLDIK